MLPARRRNSAQSHQPVYRQAQTSPVFVACGASTVLGNAALAAAFIPADTRNSNGWRRDTYKSYSCSTTSTERESSYCCLVRFEPKVRAFVEKSAEPDAEELSSAQHADTHEERHWGRNLLEDCRNCFAALRALEGAL